MTRRMSQRARAQEIYREMTDDLPSPSPQTPLIPVQTGIQNDHATPVNGCTGSPLSRGRAEEGLTARVRALYENSAVPVREIAALAGVTERTLYKYAQKGGWTPRYAWVDRRGVARRRRPAAGAVAPVKGAGGRFIRRADTGKPFAHGLKATDPAGAARATAACAQAGTIAAQAQADAALLQWNESFIDWLRTVRMIGDELAAYRQQRRHKRPGRPAEPPDAREQTLTRLGHLALDGLEFCQAQMAALLPS